MSFPVGVTLSIKLGDGPSPNKCIREVEYIIPNAEIVGRRPSGSMIFSLRATNRTFEARVGNCLRIVLHLLELSGIAQDKAPKGAIVDPDNHTIEYELAGWDDDELINFGIILEAVARASGWKFTDGFKLLNEPIPTSRGTLKC